MATKKLAKELGLVRKRSQSSAENHEKQIGCRQFFSYLIVIDFESTCWKDKNNYGQEIIEFPAVLMNTTNGKIDSEFHTYVQPQEHPILSEFCTELTGICQAQVEAGVPLQICLSLFTRWIQTLQQEKNIVFVKDKASVPSGYPCAFVTWSDWDLGVCLQYECKRKQIPKPDILNSWIDLRATYKIFYNRKPKGLNGALQDLGIEFSGREHSGLDDARNTAHLAWRMIKDGCLMKVTRTLDRALLRAKPLFPINPNTGNVGGQTVTEDGKRKSVMKQSKLVSCEKAAVPSENNPEVGEYQSLVLPKTLLQGLGTPVFKGKTFAPAVRKLVSKGSSLSANIPSLMNSNLVLVSTTVDCHTAEPGLDTTVTDSVTLLGEWEETPVLVESEESCSYDDVLLEESDPSVTSFMDTFKTYDSNCVQSTVNSSTVSDSVEHSNQIVFQNSNTTLYSLEKSRSSPSRSGVFKTPLLSNRKLSDKMMSHSKVTSSANPMATCSVAKSTRLHMIQPPISHMTPTSSFTIYKDVNDSNCSAESKLSCGSNSTPSLLPPSSTNRMSLLSRSNMKTTSPLCNCGRRAKRLTVANGGPNHGRVFFSCSIGKMGTGNKKSCGFFKWESSLTRAKSTAAAATPCSIPGTSFMFSGKSFSNKTLQISPHNFAMRPSLRN